MMILFPCQISKSVHPFSRDKVTDRDTVTFVFILLIKMKDRCKNNSNQ